MYDHPAGPPPNYGYPAMAPVHSAPSAGRGLAIASLVLSAIAVLGVIAIGLFVVASGTANTATNSGLPLTGQLSVAPSGNPLTGAALAKDVTARINQDGGEVSRMDCPATPKVDQGTVTVCHGTVSSSDYAVIVFFEDADGRFTLSPV